jgi:hypothetical protein
VAAKQEVTYLTLGPVATFACKFQFFLSIAFDEIEPVAGKSIRHILDQTVTEVETTVPAIEGEIQRLGLI